MGRKIAFVLSLAVLLINGVIGIYNGITERATGATNLQKSVTAGVFLYGVFGLVAAYGLARRRPWTVWAAIAWAVVITYVPGVATIAYSDEASPVGPAIVASAATALIALGVLWTARTLTRKKEPGPHGPGPLQSDTTL
jgi:peptidoglycan/LPS O-acetylase OafA/YrhL